MSDRLFQLEQRILQLKDESHQQMVDDDVLEEDSHNNRLLDLKQSLESSPSSDLDAGDYAAAYRVGSGRRQRRDRSQERTPEPNSPWDNQERKRYYPEDQSIPKPQPDKKSPRHQSRSIDTTPSDGLFE